MSVENPLVFLFRILLEIYSSLLILRFLLQQVRADFYNPISQFIVKLTNPVVKPARRIIPGFRGYDLATLLLVLVLIVIQVVLFPSMQDISLNPALAAIQELILLVINVFMFAIFVQAILSWVNPDPYHPVTALLYSLTYPVLRPFQQWIKPISGIDLSPMVALIVLMVARQAVVYVFHMF